MLPAERRMRRSDEFRRTVRSGGRAGTRMLVVHLLEARDPSASAAVPSATRVGFVVGRGVGGSVVRSQVTRRLRSLVRHRLDRLPEGALVVVRALGPSGSADSALLGAELDRALGRLVPGYAAGGAR